MTVPRGTACAHFLADRDTGRGIPMDTTHDGSIRWTDRLPAQILSAVALTLGVIGVFWDSGLASFLLAFSGAALAFAATAATPDGWLIAPDEEAS